MERRLAAIMAMDVVGYSRLMGADEAGTLAGLMRHRKEFVDPKIAEFQGRIVKLTGDGLLVEFASVVNALACAVAVQKGMVERNVRIPAARRMEFRVGLNLGDVIVEGDDIYGDGVNLAVRLEGVAQPGEIALSETVRDHIGNRLDIGFDYLGEYTLKNIERPVRVYQTAIGNNVSAGGLSAGQEASSATPDRPSIAVLPFDNLSGDPEQGYFADGITEDIITDLSKVSGLFVIARNSTFAYRGQALDIRRVSRELNVRYVLEGSVRRAGGRIRINAQMIDATTGGHIWAERYDRELADIFAVQDEVTRTIVDALKVSLTHSEEARRTSRRKVNPEAYDLLIRGSQNILQFRPESLREGREMLQRALELEPGLAVAHARLSIIHSVEYVNRWNDPPPDHLAKALDLAARAVALDVNEPKAHDALAISLLWLRRLDDAERAAEKMIELDPNYASGYLELGNVHHFKGENDRAVELYQQAHRLDPQFDLALHFLGRALLALRRFDEAEVAFRRRLALAPRSDMSRFYLACLYGHAGRADEARAVWSELLTLTPNFSAQHFERILPYRDTAAFDWFLAGARKAGITT